MPKPWPGRQLETTRTIIDRIQIGQWYGKHEVITHFPMLKLENNTDREIHYRPGVKVDKRVLERLRTDEG